MTSGKDRWNENVLRCRRNECSDWADVTSLGRLFHTQRAATGIARLLTDDSLTCGTIRRSDCWLQGVNITGQNNTRAKTAVTWQLRDKETSCTFWVKHLIRKCDYLLFGSPPRYDSRRREVWDWAGSAGIQLESGRFEMRLHFHCVINLINLLLYFCAAPLNPCKGRPVSYHNEKLTGIKRETEQKIKPGPREQRSTQDHFVRLIESTETHYHTKILSKSGQ